MGIIQSACLGFSRLLIRAGEWAGGGARHPGVHRLAIIKASTLGATVAVGPRSLVRNSQLWGEVRIGDHSAVVDSVISGKVSIGRYTSFNGPGSDIIAKLHGVSIGNFCSIARNCTIQEYNHITERCSTYYIFRNLIDAGQRQEYIWDGPEEKDIASRGAVQIGNDVWIGAQVVILSGVNIGNGAVIAANSTVTRDIPPYAIAGGTPARVLKYRFPDEMIATLQELAWWDWDDDTIRNNRELFESPLTPEKLARVRDRQEGAAQR